MVYHHPSEQPKCNTIPVLRLLLSDAASAKFFRYVPGTALAAITSWVGATLLARLGTHTTHGRVLPSWMVSQVTTLSLFGAVGGIGVYKAVRFTVKKWDHHVRPPEGIEKKYHFVRPAQDPDEDLSAAKQEFSDSPGIAFVKKAKKFILHPPVTTEHVAERSFNTVGMSLKDFVTMDFTVGLEYALTAWTRILRHGFGGTFGWYEPVSATSRYRLYQAVLNTSLACYTRTHHNDMDADLGVDVGGHVVLENVCLPFEDTEHRTFRKIVIFVDHEAMEFDRMALVRDGDETVEITTWGSRTHGDNTDSGRISAEESLHQAGLITAAIVAFFTHGIVHWWANAVSTMSEAVWPAGAAESTCLTQWTNTQAVLSAGFFAGNSPSKMAVILGNNAENGLPAHGVAPAQEGHSPITVRRVSASGAVVELPLFAALSERSTFHQMSAAAAAALKSHFMEEKKEVSDMEIRGIVIAVVQHSLEHYMLGELTPIFSPHSQCIALKTDLSGLLHCLVYPVNYKSRPFAHCRRRYWDSVSLTIHRACVEREEGMVAANSAAAAKGEPVPFVPLKSFCARYLHVGCSV